MQKLCLKIILPGEEGYKDRLHVAKLLPVEAHLQKRCQNYLKKIFKNPKHQLDNLVPYKAQALRQTRQAYSVHYRTSLYVRSHSSQPGFYILNKFL